jgi:hypothetical protein
MTTEYIAVMAYYYCTISINSSGTVTRDAPDENMVSATSQFRRDMSEIFGRLAPQANEKIPYSAHNCQMFSSLRQNDRDNRDILSILEGP